MSNRIDVLNLEWTSFPSRDRQMATLVCNYLRLQGYKVVEGSVFRGYYLLNKYKPKVFFITNTLGAQINLDLVKYAKSLGIRIISLISEGNFKNDLDRVPQYLWGWNKDQILYEDIHLQWSKRTKNLSISVFPELKEKIKVSGGVGFDVYKISKPTCKIDFLTKYNSSRFQKVIGIGCWDFGSFYPEDHRYQNKKKRLTSDLIHRFRNDRLLFNKILKDIIKANQDILFLVKQHPGTMLGYKASAIEGVDDYKNVLVLKNEESVFDCISVSDFWVVYESTTAIEAWLLGKQTGLLNPSGTDFPRDFVYKGSPCYRTQEELQFAIDVFYNENKLPGFDLLANEQEKIIVDIIQWDDGLNHVRAGNEIIKILGDNNKQNIRPDLSSTIMGFKENLLWLVSKYHKLIPRIRNYYLNTRAKFNNKEVISFGKIRYKQQETFYANHSLNREELKKTECI